jgi:hypothetical protein
MYTPLVGVEPDGVMPNVHTAPLRPSLEEDFGSDPRWQLLERILLTNPFQKSSRLPTLLRYLAEHSIRGDHEELTEQRIGTAVFGKPLGYSPAEDSAVRVHVRQLRLRLHEYFACEGREEPLIVDIPKGSYVLVFHSALARPLLPDLSPLNPEAERNPQRFSMRNVVSWAALMAAAICAIGWYSAVKSDRGVSVPWPVSAIIQNGEQTSVVVSDGRSMLRLLAQRQFTLDDYLKPGFLGSITPPHMDENVGRLVKYISDSQITSFADTMVTSTFVKLAGSLSGNLVVCTARDLNRRELDQGNFVFVGGPTSNPWVSIYADRLNFAVVEDGVGGKMYFLNKDPRPGEQTTYEGLRYTGAGGEDYATISLLPNSNGQGNVMILQGLREEGTEALAILLADKKDRAELSRALNIHANQKGPTYFEALIRARTVAGAPVSISIVATRILPS